MESEDDDVLYTQAAIDEYEEDEAFLDWITFLEVTDFSFEMGLEVRKISPEVGSTLCFFGVSRMAKLVQAERVS